MRKELRIEEMNKVLELLSSSNHGDGGDDADQLRSNDRK